MYIIKGKQLHEQFFIFLFAFLGRFEKKIRISKYGYSSGKPVVLDYREFMLFFIIYVNLLEVFRHLDFIKWSKKKPIFLTVSLIGINIK